MPRMWVMRKCLIQGYEQVDLLTKKHRDDYWVEKRLMKSNAKDGVGATSNRDMIRNTLDKLIPAVKSFEQLVECLTNIYGWNIRVTEKTVTFTMPDMKRGIRGNKLGDGYGKAELIERIDIAIKEKAIAETKRIAEENARAEAMRIAETMAKADAGAKENARIEAEKKVAVEKAEQNRKAELSKRKRKLAFERENIRFECFMANADSDTWNSDYADYLMGEKITDYDSKTMEELSVPIMTKKEFEQKQIKKMQEAISERAGELWHDALDNIDGIVYPHKWEYLDYLEELRYRKASTVTLQQVKNAILSFEEFNEKVERESAMHVESVESVQNFVAETAADNEQNFEPDVTENIVVQKNPAYEPAVEETVVVEHVMERILIAEERAKEIANFIRDNYGKYDGVPVKVKAELFRFSIDDLQADMKLHSLVLKELNEKMYSSELYDDYMSIIDATEKKQSDESQEFNYYSNDRRWIRGR